MKIGKEETMWVVQNGDSHMQFPTLRFLRKDAINAFIRHTNYTWDELKLYGWRIKKVKVLITEIE